MLDDVLTCKTQLTVVFLAVSTSRNTTVSWVLHVTQLWNMAIFEHKFLLVSVVMHLVMIGHLITDLSEIYC